MKKTMHKALLLAGLVSMISTAPVMADGRGAEVELLKEQIKLLMEQNNQLTSRIKRLEEVVGAKSSTAVSDQALKEKIHTLDDQELQHQDTAAVDQIKDHVTLSGLVEVEGMAGEDFAGNTESTFELATVELGFDARANDWASGHVLILYEQGGDDKVLIDEAFITLGNSGQAPLYLKAGRLYVPFGSFETGMISDPLTLEIAETQETALQLGFTARGLYGSVFAFNGDTNEGGGDSRIEQFGAHFGYMYERDNLALDVGVGYMNSMGDSDGLSEILAGEHLLEADYVGGLAVHAIAAVGPVTLIGEYITALDDFDGNNSQPMAFQLETDYRFQIWERESSIGIAYQGTDDLGGYLPESRILATAAIEVFPATRFAIEYAHDEDYDTDQNGTGESADAITGQLAYEF